MIDGPSLDQVRLYLPQYLSPERQQDLWKDLHSFPAGRTIYSDRNDYPHFLQADGWRGFVAINFDTLERRSVSGLVLSNSCDVNPVNRRSITPSITFVPLIRLRRYMELLEASGLPPRQCQDIAETIRKQRSTSLMYLPSNNVMDESIANFGDVHSHPLNRFATTKHARLFRLSDFGFYLFLFKLSIHFTRMLEDADR